jgi:hypothetical protein
MKKKKFHKQFWNRRKQILDINECSKKIAEYFFKKKFSNGIFEITFLVLVLLSGRYD